jgi:PAS domain S-box-containing protein
MSPTVAPVNLLLVDDRPENLVALCAILDSPEYRLVTAASGREALEKVALTDFAIILLDVAMPEMTGFEVADRLKQDERTTHIPILFLTAVATELDEIYRAYRIGAVDYLIKPLNIAAVRSKVAVFADLYRQRREIERQAQLLYETERRAHELQMAELRVASDQRYRKLVQGIDHAFAWSADAEGQRLSFVSHRAQEVLGYGAEQLAQPGFLLEHVHPDDRETTRRAFATAVAERRDLGFTHRLIAADGTVRWVHTGVSATTAVGDHVVELQGVSVDVTDIKRAEERQQRLARENARLYEHAAKAAQARTELLEVISHDLRDPLGSVAAHAQRIHRGLAADEAPAVLTQWAERIERAAGTMSRLVADLVDSERIDTGRLSIERRPHLVGSLLSGAVEMVEPAASAKSVELRVQADAVSSARVLCDADRIAQVLSNLLGNAIKFSPPGAQVVLAARPDGGDVLFSVHDSGPGIDPEDLPHIFDRRWQAEEWARYGLGLGLTIARGLVEAHQGRIWAESEPGKGTTFYFKLPAMPPDKSVGPAAAG